MSRRTFEKICQFEDDHPWSSTKIGTGRHSHELVRPGIFPLFVSRFDACLTHRTRYCSWHFKTGRLSFHGECGTMLSGLPVRVSDELFLCHACFAACEKYGIDHFNLVPATGCEVSNGRRGRTMARRKVTT